MFLQHLLDPLSGIVSYHPLSLFFTYLPGEQVANEGLVAFRHLVFGLYLPFW